MKSHKKSAYSVIKQMHITEKSSMLQQLHTRQNNPSIRACHRPKYVFLVDVAANKVEIAKALEEIYKEKNITVYSVNTIKTKGRRRRVRGKIGMTSSYKKAIVTLNEGDSLE